MVEYSKVNVKLTDNQLEKLKAAPKDKTETILKMSLKTFDEMICHMNCYWQQDKKQG